MNTTQMTTTNGNDEFYPTPPELAQKMLDGVDLLKIKTILEPSAGKGDLLHAFVKAYDKSVEAFCDNHGWSNYGHGLSKNDSFSFDCVEIDPHLRQILKYEFAEKRAEMLEEMKSLRQKEYHGNLSDDEKQRWKDLDKQTDYLARFGVHIVHDNFLTYRPYRHYDLILMNPPFSDGDKHLLKAIEIAELTGSTIVCLLNAETVRNPYSKSRMVLQNKLKEYGAVVEFVENAFASAERRASVDIAIVKLSIPEPQYEYSDIWDRMEQAERVRAIPDAELHALVAGDYIEQAIQLYNAEIKATLELVAQYKALVPYMPRVFAGQDDFDKTPILQLKLDGGSDYDGFNLEKYIQKVRHKYWYALLHNEQFVGKLTSELRDQWRSEIDKLSAYEFSAFNIKQMLVEMNGSITQGVEKAILDLFEKLTSKHSWFPECENNIHYYNGWATNKAHKIGKKSIIPTHGMFSHYSCDKTFNTSTAYKVISDIEKALSYLDDGRIADSMDLHNILGFADKSGKTRNISCKYFSIDMYKKGTTHIKFHPETMPLIDRLNIYASRKKGWLPPRYGKATYGDMSAEEKAVVDSFHGDGTEGSGEEKYRAVLMNAAFYLAESTESVPLLSSAS